MKKRSKKLLSALLLLQLTSCGVVRLAETVPSLPVEPLTETIIVLDDGWHTEIVLPVAALDGPLRHLHDSSFPTATWMSFSFGERRYELMEKPGAIDNLIAILPGPGIVMAIGLGDTLNPTMQVTQLKLTRTGLEHLVDFIWNDFQRDSVDTPQVLRIAPEWNMRVYASNAAYDGTYTCNTWTLEALRAAGLDTAPFGVLFAGQTMDQIKRIAAKQAVVIR